MKPKNRKYEIEIPETSPKELLKKSIENIRLEAIQEKVSLEAEIDHSRKYMGSPMPNRAEYLINLGRQFMQKKVLKLW